MMADPPAYSPPAGGVPNPTAPPQGQPQGQPPYPQTQPTPYPPSQSVAYPQGQAVAYNPQGAYPQGVYPQGQAIAYQPAGQTVVLTQGTTTHVYQSAPQQQCCSGIAEHYNVRGGVGTGVTQLVIGILSVILGAVACAFPTFHVGYGIWAGIFFFIPTGILGIASKNKSQCVIIAYMVMSILCTLQTIGMMSNEGVAAGVYSLVYSCEYIWFTPYCSTSYNTGAVVVHSMLAILAFIEFIVGIVGAAYCCGGLPCCCGPPPTPTQPNTTVVMPGQAQPMTVVAQPPNSAGNEKEFSRF